MPGFLTVEPTDDKRNAQISLGRLFDIDWIKSVLLHSGKPWSIVSPEPLCVNTDQANGCKEVRAECDGVLVKDVLRWEDGRLCIDRSWTNTSDTAKSDLTLGARVLIPCESDAKITIPHVLYNGNPSAAPERLVPRFGEEIGYTLLVEEHRLPIPGINIEWESGGKRQSVSLIVHPCPAGLDGSNEVNNWWTLGVRRVSKGIEIISASGAVCFNKVPETIYGSQNESMEMQSGYVTLKPGEQITKRMWIEAGECNHAGHGFRRLVRSGFSLLNPQGHPALSLDETIQLKTNALTSRFRNSAAGSGFAMLPETAEEGNVYNVAPGFLGGWVGQNLKLAWCAMQLGSGTDKSDLTDMAIRTLDTWVGAPKYADIPELRCHFLDWKTGEWFADETRRKHTPSTRMIGENLTDLADCITLARSLGLETPSTWLDALASEAAFLACDDRLTNQGIFPMAFAKEGKPKEDVVAAGGAPCICALLAAGDVLSDASLTQKALAILERYHALFADNFDKPFARSTLDAACEDKEAGIYFFLASYRAWKLTRESIYADWAQLSAEWISTFVYMWSVPFRKETACARNGFNSTFWPGVSVQNHHLDVFFPAWEVYDIGKDLDDEMLMTIGKGVVGAWSHGIAQTPGHWGFPTPGEQGEQFNHTNYYQGPFGRDDWRGSTNKWNPSWINALVLQAALKFTK